jgi:hypothetical protein
MSLSFFIWWKKTFFFLLLLLGLKARRPCLIIDRLSKNRLYFFFFFSFYIFIFHFYLFFFSFASAVLMSLPADPLKESIEDGCGVGWRWVGINGWKKN